MLGSMEFKWPGKSVSGIRPCGQISNISTYLCQLFGFNRMEPMASFSKTIMFLLVVGTPCSAFDLSAEFFRARKEVNANTVLCKNGGVLW